MGIESLPLTTVGIILGFSIVLSVLFKRLGQNPVLGFILSGFLLGPFVLGFIKPEDELIYAFSELGLFVLLFYLGIELSFKDFMKGGLPTLLLALIDMATIASSGALIALLFGFTPLFALIIGVMLFCTSSAIVGKFILDNKLEKQPSAQMGLAILIIQDFLGILILVFISGFSGEGSPTSLALTSLVFAVASFYVVHKLSKLVEGYFDRHTISITELGLYGLCIGLIVAMLGSFLGLSSALGAYFAGFALSELRVGEKVKEQIGFVRDFFLLFFFVAFGASLFFDSATEQVIVPEPSQLVFVAGFALLMTILIVVQKAVVFTAVGPLFGLTNRSSSEISVLLMPLGEFVIIIAISVAGTLSGIEAIYIFPIAFLMILFTLLTFQPLYKMVDLHDRITSMIPALAPRPQFERASQEHTPESTKLLKSLALNTGLFVCLIWITVQLYEAIPVIGIQIPYARFAVAAILFIIFAAAPFMKMARTLRKLWYLAKGTYNARLG